LARGRKARRVRTSHQTDHAGQARSKARGTRRSARIRGWHHARTLRFRACLIGPEVASAVGDARAAAESFACDHGDRDAVNA
jgi:hypothetical protein